MSINPYGDDLFAGFYNVNDRAAARKLVAERVSDHFVDHSPVFGASPDKVGFADTVAAINSAFAQEYRIVRTIEQGDTVVGIWEAAVEHVGPFLGVPPTGRQFRLQGITAYALRDGLVTDHWEQFAVVKILTELGILPPLGG